MGDHSKSKMDLPSTQPHHCTRAELLCPSTGLQTSPGTFIIASYRTRGKFFFEGSHAALVQSVCSDPERHGDVERLFLAVHRQGDDCIGAS